MPRFIDTSTGDFVWKDDPNSTRYVILSHVWSRQGELSFRDVCGVQDKVSAEREMDPKLRQNETIFRLSPKLRDVCLRARHEGFALVWIDSCCIDKASSAELSEAINSMYSWYAAATLCYVFLQDVDADDDPHGESSQFRKSEWFTRGWTLQELIAPTLVIFYDKKGRLIGGKHGLAGVIEEITGIDSTILTGRLAPNYFSVAQRMCWASNRITTRQEDAAYSLMGLFNVNMPTIYGEGSEKAFRRLQEEILKTMQDQSIFAWDWLSADSASKEMERRALLAPSPAAFAHSANIRSIPQSALSRALFSVSGLPGAASRLPSYSPTPHGIRAILPRAFLHENIYMVPLACEDPKEDENHVLTLLLTNTARGPHQHHEYVVGISAEDQLVLKGLQFRRWPRDIASQGARLIYLPQDHVKQLSVSMELDIVRSSSEVPALLQRCRPDMWIPARPLKDDMEVISDQFNLALHPRYESVLSRFGYVARFFPNERTLRIYHGPQYTAVEFTLTSVLVPGNARSPTARSAQVPPPAPRGSLRSTLHAQVVTSFPLETGIPSSVSPMRYVRVPDEVEEWVPAPRDERARLREVVLPPACGNPGSDGALVPMWMRLVATRESPGSKEYPALFSLAIEVLRF